MLYKLLQSSNQLDESTKREVEVHPQQQRQHAAAAAAAAVLKQLSVPCPCRYTILLLWLVATRDALRSAVAIVFFFNFAPLLTSLEALRPVFRTWYGLGLGLGSVSFHGFEKHKTVGHPHRA